MRHLLNEGDLNYQLEMMRDREKANKYLKVESLFISGDISEKTFLTCAKL